MRLWSIHPKYLDRQGLVALWRESLLAKKVLENKTKGYKNHPQLERFKQSNNPIYMINIYLESIYDESRKRGYNFDKSKIGSYISSEVQKIPIKREQIIYEVLLLRSKLKRSPIQIYKNDIYGIWDKINPLFYEVDGPIENWEKIKEVL